MEQKLENQESDAIREEMIKNYLETSDVVKVEKKVSEERKKVSEQFSYFGIAALIYAVIYTVCMYKNLTGLASTLLIYTTLAATYVCFGKLEIKFEKKHVWYAVAIALLGTNLMFTADAFVLFIDYVAIVMIYITGVFTLMYDSHLWDFADNLKAMNSHIWSSLGDTFEFTNDWSKNTKKGEKSTTVKYIVLGIIIAIPLLVVVVALLSSADAMFEQMTDRLFDNVDIFSIIGVGLTFVGALLGFYAWLSQFTKKEIKISTKDKRVQEPAIMITICVILGVVYIAFCGIQIVYLFAGIGELPKNYTYAEYAREGFFQLLVVCLINMVIVLLGISYFKENKVLKVILTFITGCTYIMIASSAYRMYLYVSEYNLSLLRIWVLWTLAWLTIILTGALINIYKNTFSLYRFAMVVTTVMYIMFAFARPANVVARYNLAHVNDKGFVDIDYMIYDMNYDAAPAIYEYIENGSNEGIATGLKNLTDIHWSDDDDYSSDMLNLRENDNQFSIRKFNISEYYMRSHFWE